MKITYWTIDPRLAPRVENAYMYSVALNYKATTKTHNMITYPSNKLVKTRKLRLLPNHHQRGFLVKWGIAACILRNHVIGMIKNHPDNQHLGNPWYIPSAEEISAVVDKVFSEKEWMQQYPKASLLAQVIEMATKLKDVRLPDIQFKNIRNPKRLFTIAVEDYQLVGHNGIKLLGYGQLQFVKRKRDWDVPKHPLTARIRSTADGHIWLELTYLTIPRNTPLFVYNAIGIDVGIKNMLILSNGTKVGSMVREGAEFYGRAMTLLKRTNAIRTVISKLKSKKKTPWKKKQIGEQYALLNKFRGSLARIRAKIANRKTHSLHAIVRGLVGCYDVIGVETINYAGFSHDTRLKTFKARWHHFYQLLENRVKEYGKALVYGNRFLPSSHICSTTLTRMRQDFKLSLSVREFECPTCHQIHDRDENASVVIKAMAVNTLLEQLKIEEHELKGPIVAFSQFRDRIPRYYDHTVPVQKGHLAFDDMAMSIDKDY